MTNNVILDFTPDQIDDEYQVGRFLDVFQTNNVTTSNQFLDYDKSGQVDSDNAQTAVRKISSRLQRILKPYKADANVELTVFHTNNLTNAQDPGVGEKSLRMDRTKRKRTPTSFTLATCGQAVRYRNSECRIKHSREKTTSSTVTLSRVESRII